MTGLIGLGTMVEPEIDSVDRDVKMLRALGIAFIVCSAMFAGLLAIGLGWWAIASGTVRIAGINDDAETASAEMISQATSGALSVSESVPTAEALADPWPPGRPVEQAPGRQHFARNGNVFRTAALTASSGDPALDSLQGARLIAVIAYDTAKVDVQLAGDVTSDRTPAVFPSAVDRVRVILERSPRQEFDSGLPDAVNDDMSVLADHFLQFEALERGSAEWVPGFERQRLQVEYQVSSDGIVTAYGLRDEISRVGQVNVQIAADDSSITFDRTFNGFYEKVGTSPAQNPVRLFGSFLRLYHTVQPSGATTRFFVGRATSPGAAFEIREVRPSPISRKDETGPAVEFRTATQLAGLETGDSGRLFAVTSVNERLVGSRILELEPVGVPTGLSVQIPTSAQIVRHQGAAYLPTKATLRTKFKNNNSDAVDLILETSEGGVILDAQRTIASAAETEATSEVVLPPGRQNLQTQLVVGQDRVVSSESLPVIVLPHGPRVEHVNSSQFTQSNAHIIRIQFDRDIPLKEANATTETNYSLTSVANDSTAVNPIDTPIFDRLNNTVQLQFSRDIRPGTYTLSVANLVDVLDQPMVDAAGTAQGFSQRITKSTSSDVPLVQRGIGAAGTGQHVEFPEYTEPRDYPSGFNPSDKVVTRVARLYYFRDAHRVTQIVNRQARSYNRQAVDMKQQFADASRRDTDQATVARRQLENKAIRAAQEARAAENALEDHQQALITARDRVGRFDQQILQLDALIMELEQQINSASAAAMSTTEPNTATTPDTTTATASATGTTSIASTTIAGNGTAIGSALSGTGNPSTPDQRLNTLKSTRDALIARRSQAELDVIQEEGAVRQLLSTVQSERSREITATERWEDAEQEERLKAEEQFRREVAAKTEDPDTYVAGDPDSDDPVSQVSLSVVGEGLIQLRGPRKGVNEVHKMINQLDAPVGQVKIALHTVQVNGEGGDRMEKVVARIQRYLDHSRFLTVQSGEMLRNAVVSVASRQASMMADTYPPGMPQQMRDVKYQEAFFGEDFVQELRSMDSEFLRTGNKVLSLHSMDTTSLSNALFLMSLAKNDVREEILAEFQAAVQCKLPQDELEFFQESGAEFKFRHKEFQFLGQNAQFVALRGFFAAQVAGSDTLNPMQREFIRLAQIFKARLITEIELRQRVMERSLIEERIGTAQEYRRLQQEAKQAEEDAQRAVKQFRTTLRNDLRDFLPVVAGLALEVEGMKDTIGDNARRQNRVIDDTREQLDRFNRDNVEPSFLPGVRRLQDRLFVHPAIEGSGVTPAAAARPFRDRFDEYTREVESSMKRRFGKIDWNNLVDDFDALVQASPVAANDGLKKALDDLRTQLTAIRETYDLTEPYRSHAEMAEAVLGEQTGGTAVEMQDQLNRASRYLAPVTEHVVATSEAALKVLAELSADLQQAMTSRDGLDRIPRLIARWDANYDEFKPSVSPRGALARTLAKAHQGFSNLKFSHASFTAAIAEAAEARRPLDHKKFLDMLVDDVEEKFIELVEGTRAQTSNIDNYLKRLGTALEDDFNAQFYHPAFRYVRETSYFYDVTVGQVETTSVVANNRMFAKVSPQATMEFDLPKRDILINEAMNSALAAYDDYGALIGDPNFLSLMKLYGGQPASNTFGQQFGSPYVQEVLPGLPSGTDSQFLTSARNNVPRIGSSLEALIPDPAIYKFETGTGYEIRPVIQPDGQAVVFHLDYMYTTNVREPVRADEKHLGRVKRHFINTDVVSGNYELREVSMYRVGLKASRTSRGVPLLEDAPGIGVLFRPQASAESSTQQNIILTQSVIYPTLFDLMGLRWAPAVADLDSLSLQEREFVTRQREKFLQNEVFDYSSLQVDQFMRIPEGERRGDLYRTQETIPHVHPNGYQGRGLNIRNDQLQEGYSPEQFHPPSQFVPRRSEDASFSLEEPPSRSFPDTREDVVPGTEVPVESFEGAMPISTPGHTEHESLQLPSGFDESIVPMSYQVDTNNEFESLDFPEQLLSTPQSAVFHEARNDPAGIEENASGRSRRHPVSAEPATRNSKTASPDQTTGNQQSAAGRNLAIRRSSPKKGNRVSRFFKGVFRR